MTTFLPVGIDSLLIYINKAFMEDEKLCSDYHVVPGSYLDCATDTYNRIIDELKIYTNNSIFGIKEGNEKIGYIVMVNDAFVLYSFGINKNYRTYAIKQEFITFVNNYLKNKTTVYLYDKNTRAIGFFKKNGFKETLKLFDKKEPVTKLELCQYQQPSH